MDDSTNEFQDPPWFEDLKTKTKDAGIWNWFLSREYEEWSPGLFNLEFAPIMEQMCQVPFSTGPGQHGGAGSFRFTCPAGKMAEAAARRPDPPAFSMTEPAVASSDVGNLETTIAREGDVYVINGRKWFTSNAFNPLCKVFVVMGKSNPDAVRHRHFSHWHFSMILVPKDTPVVTLERPLCTFSNVDSPGGHAHVLYDNVRGLAENLLLGEGCGFEIPRAG